MNHQNLKSAPASESNENLSGPKVFNIQIT